MKTRLKRSLAEVSECLLFGPLAALALANVLLWLPTWWGAYWKQEAHTYLWYACIAIGGLVGGRALAPDFTVLWSVIYVIDRNDRKPVFTYRLTAAVGTGLLNVVLAVTLWLQLAR